MSPAPAAARIHICVGAGGVGKTTTAAALALSLAARGERVAVVTIDPAKRLAGALGLRELGGEPHLIDPRRFATQGIELRGELWAMMLDPKRTFDELIGRLAPDERSRDDVLANRVYRELSSAVAGSQEFTAIAKLYELDREGGFDAIVLDTPPSRNALDFLAAPLRLTQFFEGRALRALLAPGRIMGRGTGIVFSILKRLTGVDLLTDLSAFFLALSGMIDGFNERAAGVDALLRRKDTAFVLITSPEHEPMREALEFALALRSSGLQISRAIVNRVHSSGEASTRELAGVLEPRLVASIASYLEDHAVLAERDRLAIERLRREAPGVALTLVPEMAGDVHDLAGLARVARHLELQEP
ncbi:MAG: ArsA family ATPase [Solirubrobacteraceae bacterium]